MPAVEGRELLLGQLSLTAPAQMESVLALSVPAWRGVVSARTRGPLILPSLSVLGLGEARRPAAW